MNTIDLGKIGITLGGEWVSAATYEYLTMVTRHGISYVSKRTTTNEDPELVSAAWQPCSLRGESLYELMVDTGRFVGTLDEFLDEYEGTLQDAQDAASAANESNREFTEAEGLRVTAENGRVLAENNRVDQETYRETTFAGYNARIESIEGSEATRQSNENTRQLNEGTRQSNETARVTAEGTVEGHTGRAYAESQRVANENARIAAEGTVQSQTGRAYAESLRVTAEQDRVNAENQRQIAEGNPDDAASATGSRWARYKYAEAARDTSYGVEEGSSASSTAGDGSRWGSYKTAEAERSADVEMLKETKANIDGYYSQMTVGLAENLVSPDGITDSEPYIYRTSAGDTSIGTGYATLEKVEGHTVKFNQHVKNGDFSDGTTDWTATNSTISASNNILTQTFNPAGGYGYNYALIQYNLFSEIHTFFVRIQAKSAINTTIIVELGGGYSVVKELTSNVDTAISTICIPSQYNKHLSIHPSAPPESSYTIEYSNINIIDLTAMFGSDAEIAAALGIETSDIKTDIGVAAFEAWITKNVGYKDYYPYTDGKLVSVNVDGLKTVGFNQWDEEWEQGNYSDETGAPTPTSSYIRSKNAIKVFPQTAYYKQLDVRVFYYDINNNYIGHTSSDRGIFTTPANCHFIRIRISYAAPYNHDICINLSWSGYRNGEYEPYWSETLDLAWIKSLKDTNDNQLFPYGLLSAGSVKDEVTATKAIKRVGVVDLGTVGFQYGDSRLKTLNQFPVKTGSRNIPAVCSKYKVLYNNEGYPESSETVSYFGAQSFWICDPTLNASSIGENNLVAALSGVMLYYELATPIEIDITPEKNLNYKVDDFGTEEFVSTTLVTPQTAAPYQVTHYMDNLRDKLRNTDSNYVAFNVDQTNTTTNAQKAQARKNIDAVEKDGSYPNMSVGAATNLIGHGTVTAEYTYRTSGGTADIGTGAATIDTIKGKTLKWNQLFLGDSTGSYTISGPADYYGMIPGSNVASNAVNVINGHKYYISLKIERSIAGNGGCALYLGGTTSTEAANISFGVTDSFVNGFRSVLVTANATKTLTGIGYNNYVYARGFASGDYLTVSNINVIDLTQMFGETIANSMTVEEFEALYPLDYYAYTATPVLINNAASGIVTTGFNQWDEEWELGYIDENGQNVSSTGYIRSKNYIPVIGNNNYFFKISTSKARLYTYDTSKNLVSIIGWVNSPVGGRFLVPSNAAYIRFWCDNSYGTTYRNDINLNLSWSGYRNGEYEPYEQHTLYFNGESGSLATLTGKKLIDGEPTGESVTIFPDGMKSAGSVYDFGKADSDGYIRKVTKRFGVVDLGDLTSWQREFVGSVYVFRHSFTGSKVAASGHTTIVCNQYNDTLTNVAVVNNNKSIGIQKNYYWSNEYIFFRDDSHSAAPTSQDNWLDGVLLYYELATPEEYLLDTPIPANYIVNDFGTEQRLPVDTASSMQAPILYDVKYAMNATDTIRRLPINYMSVESFENFCTELATELGDAINKTITITPTYDSTHDEYDYSITIEEPQNNG